MKRTVVLALFIAAGALAATAGFKIYQAESTLNSTGKAIVPVDKGVAVGSYPVQMKLSPNGRWLVVTNTGFREQLSVIEAGTGHVASTLEFNKSLSQDAKECLYWGLQFIGDDLYVSRGPEEKVSIFSLGRDGSLTAKREIANPKTADQKLPNFVSGLSCDGSTLYALNNEAGTETQWRGTVSEIDLASGQSRGKISVGGFPLDAAMTKDSAGQTKEVWVSCEQDGVVSYFHPGARVADNLQVGANPTALLLRGNTLYVSNSGSDTVSVIDTVSHAITKTILLRPAQLRSIPGCTPLGLDLSADGSTLYVALADMNAVAVVDVAQGQVRGYIPVGWYPTDVKLAQRDSVLYVSNAKGVETRVPNGKPAGKWGTYIQNIIEGTVSRIDLGATSTQLPQWTQQTYANNRLASTGDQKPRPFKNPGIKHVIYIIKENRTYDNMLGDLAGGNGDPSLCLFPREVSPNTHALAERFVLLDNFFCCAEVSGDGWNWSTAGAANEYVSRNVPFSYSGRDRDYDFEGAVNGNRPEFEDAKNVAAPPGGYLWDNCRKSHVSMRNYGFYVGESDAGGVKAGADGAQVMEPRVKALIGVTDPAFDQFDLDFPDSELNQSYGNDVPKELKAFGQYRSPSRFSEWKREFDGYVKSGKLPQLQMIRFCRDHTAGTRAGVLSPRAMVADNDYAVGELVDAVSHSKFWKDTMICVVEDDAQSGLDHVDCHRSIAFVVSPYIKRGAHDSRFYNTDGMIRTMEAALGMPPMNGFDLVADPIDDFTATPDNIEAFDAIKPSKEIAGEINKARDYRSADSARISMYTENSEMDEQLNDILWRSIKGTKTPLPVGHPDDR